MAPPKTVKVKRKGSWWLSIAFFALSVLLAGNFVYRSHEISKRWENVTEEQREERKLQDEHDVQERDQGRANILAVGAVISLLIGVLVIPRRPKPKPRRDSGPGIY